MPYIKQNDRPNIDKYLAHLSAEFDNCSNDVLCGRLNYTIFRLARMLCDANSDTLNYARINTIIGAIESAKAEFQRRVVAPYEDTKIRSNGDVCL